jgi:hypothetical protein
MTRGGRLFRIVPLVLAVAAAAPMVAQPRERFTLGVLRRDGVILPFASFDGDWSMPWPVSTRDLELPITLDAVPPKWWGGELPAAWTLWPTTVGASTIRVTPKAPIAIVVGHEKRLGVLTDYVSSEPPATRFELPYPKEGLVVAGNLTIEPIARVSKLSAAWKDLTAAIQEDIEAAEHKAINAVRGNTRWVHPISRERRRGVSATLEAWYTSSLEQPGFSVSYIEAVKQYPPGEDDKGCGLETFVSGWVYSNVRQKQPKTDLTARVTYCDRQGASYMLPFGLFRANNRTHWVFQISSWESEWYTVVEATPGRVRFVAEYFGGGRPPAMF